MSDPRREGFAMAKYLILIYGNEQRWENMTPTERREIHEGHRAFRTKAGATVLAAGELEESGTATSLRGVEDGTPVITDGPYAEAKEALGGFYVIDAGDLDHAIALSAELAEVGHDHSGVEIRPLVDHGEHD